MGRRGNPKDVSGKTIGYDIFHSTKHFRSEFPRGDGNGMGPLIHLAQTASDIQCVDWGALAASEDSPPAAVHLVSAKYMGASLPL
eukprot:1709201-Pyramimonas_sp.AAC.1